MDSTRWDGPLKRVFYAEARHPGFYVQYESLPDRLLSTVVPEGIMVPTDTKKRGKKHVEVGTVATWELIAQHIHHGLRHPGFRAHVEAELARVAADPSVVVDPGAATPEGDGS